MKQVELFALSLSLAIVLLGAVATGSVLPIIALPVLYWLANTGMKFFILDPSPYQFIHKSCREKYSLLYDKFFKLESFTSVKDNPQLAEQLYQFTQLLEKVGTSELTKSESKTLVEALQASVWALERAQSTESGVEKLHQIALKISESAPKSTLSNHRD
jgi:hypothetical protein